MRAYIQRVRECDWIYLPMVEAAHWFGQRGYEVIWFEIWDIAGGMLDDDLPHNPDEMVVRGGVGTIRQLLSRAGRSSPPNIDLPPSLSPWIGRRTWDSTLGKVRASVNAEGFCPIHVKPLYDHRGDPLAFPDVTSVRLAVQAFEGRPISFGMDWGITSSDQTLLVEVNDGFSLGNYGLRGPEYTAIIEARWRELMGLPDNGVGEM